MGNAAEISKYINPIRRGAESVCDRPFGADSFLDACLCIDRSGMPDRYGLTATAREFAVFQNGEQLAVTLAGRVGDPRVSPAPPLWPLLAVLLLGWRDTLTAKQIMNRAGDVGAEDHVHRGLAIVAHLFPELQGWLASVPLGIPRWERTVALPLAARKLVFFEEMDQARSADSDVVSSSTPITQTLGPIRWNVTGGTRRGMSHVQSDLKNQDAIRYLVSREAATVVLAVADGHGSDLCFRSDVGSRIAVETAVEVLTGFANTGRCEFGYNIRYQDGAALAEKLTQSWRTAVNRDLGSEPITKTEWGNLVARQGWQGRDIIERHPELAYGSTILAVLATETYVLSMQLGDGDILFLDSQGRTRRAIPENDRVVVKSMPSLWWQNAAAEMRIHLHHGVADLPALILAATDGYAKSCEYNKEFLNIGSHYLETARAEGYDRVEKRLEGFLNEASSYKGADDITVGVISRFEGNNMPIRETAGQKVAAYVRTGSVVEV